MKCRSYPFDKLPFSDLFCKYTLQSDSLKPFYQAHPLDNNQVKKRADQIKFSGNRGASVEALERFNKQFETSEQTLRNISRLNDPNALAVVTGQQLTLYGGPLFTIYKTVTAIIYSRRWEEMLKRPVIPVFWLADEDHDFPEAGMLGLLNNDHWHQLSISNGQHSKPVGREILGDEFKKFEKQLLELLPKSDFTPGLIEDLQKYYREGVSFREAFGNWFLHLFARHGLILAGSDDPEIKKLTFEPMLLAAQQHEDLFKLLDGQSEKLEKSGFNRQALVQESNLFYIDPEHGRQKLEIKNQNWISGNGTAWQKGELTEEIRNHPQNFSPNVFLRPMMQDRLLPTLAYVAGPGELAYYGQMKSAYNLMNQEMPMLLPRFSVTLKEPAIHRIMKELPVEMHEYSKRIEDLESLFIERSGRYDIEGYFDSWLDSIDKITDEKKPFIEEIDPTLVASADKAGQIFSNELDNLKTKVYRSIKKTEGIQLNRIRRVKENLFPGGNLQERQLALIYYMNKYGPDIWDRLLDTLADEIPDSHKVVLL